MLTKTFLFLDYFFLLLFLLNKKKKMIPISFLDVYTMFQTLNEEKLHEMHEASRPKSAFQRFLCKEVVKKNDEIDGFYRMQLCRDALSAMDRRGWNRSHHQRMFHDHFIRACARIFFKNDPPGSFARAHQAILEINAWDNLSQEVLISTPRRFGKTISVSMFAAAMVYACPSIEISIYSTCKRISQKLLRNVQKFFYLIYAELKTTPMREIRSNMEEVVLQGNEDVSDIRIVNSYPSKVSFCVFFKYMLVYRIVHHAVCLVGVAAVVCVCVCVQ